MDTLAVNSANKLARLYIDLNQMGLSYWMPAVTTLIHHLQGLERYIPPDEPSPLDQLVLVVTDAQRCDPLLRDLLIKRRLARLPVFYYRATDIRPEQHHGHWWDPLQQPFAEFAEGCSPQVWHDWEPWPVPTVVEQWLKRQLTERKKGEKR